jgi:hypothetical protein
VLLSCFNKLKFVCANGGIVGQLHVNKEVSQKGVSVCVNVVNPFPFASSSR